MIVTVSRLVAGISFMGKAFNENEYAMGPDGKPLRFASAREAVNFLADHNYTIEDLREMDFNVKEEADGKHTIGH